jgi:hypothetical protein
MARIYDTEDYQKHKRPTGWGSLCPKGISQEQAQALLDSGVLVEDAIFNVEGKEAFRAFEHEADKWHGHPIPWSRLPNDARKLLVPPRGAFADARRRTELGLMACREPG